ncbi:MAG: Gfo/Idh/MocA family oxidoreductase [Candidatus Marinimicrobia bacterium]|nr:Gfo/Idh/MocA family oxidoreductase [Candidatus Neomarinimicrobiota bacterium]
MNASAGLVSDAKIKTAILGYGRSGSTLHADPLEGLPDQFAVTAICDIDPQAQAKARARFPCPVYSDYHEMLAAQDLDLVVIVTRSDQHCAMTCDCLRGGAHVLVTKPWAVAAGEAERMIATAAATGRQLLPWLPARWGCDLIRLKELVASGIIGEIFMVRRREFNFGLRSDWQTRKQFGGGYLLNWGPHIVDQAMQLVGGRVISAYGQLRQIINPGDVEDVFHAVLITQTGVILSCEYAIAVNKLPNWVIQGNRGTIFVKETAIEIHRTDLPETIDPQDYRTKVQITESREELTGGHRITMDNRYGDPFVVYPAIAQALRGAAPYPVTTDSALALSRVLDAIRLSNATNQVVPLS